MLKSFDNRVDQLLSDECHHIRFFSGGFMALGFATNDGATFDRDIDTIRERFAALDIKTKYYSPEIHKGSFALPPYIAEKIA
jgi:spermidine synthase